MTGVTPQGDSECPSELGDKAIPVPLQNLIELTGQGSPGASQDAGPLATGPGAQCPHKARGRDFTKGARLMYLFTIDRQIYGRRDGQAMSLTEAMAAVYGCRNARVVRADGTTVVECAGSASEVTYAPKGRRITRRMTRRAALRWLATQEPTIRADVNPRAYAAL